MSGSTTDPGDRSSAELEREVEATRAGLTDTLGTLRERASPNQLFEQALDYARSSGGMELLRNLGQAVRDNPLPLVLIGAGVGWLMFSGGSRASTPAGSGARFRADSGPDERHGAEGIGASSLAEGASAVGDRLGEAANDLRDSVTGAVRQTAETAGTTYRSVTDAAGSAADSVRAAASSAMDRISGDGQGTGEQLGSFNQGAQQGLGWLVREQPLVLGAIGVALGAAVGALLPGTETENRLMGEARDSAAQQVQAAAQEGYDRAKEAVGEATEQAKDQLSGSSGSAGQLGDALTSAAQQVRRATREAAHDVAAEASGATAGEEKGGPGPSEGKAPRRGNEAPSAGPAPTPSGPGAV
jgi:ElaB/YqjD/DUF883 family membrane-anchored ribosome-binding protein